jgi:GT2 family glycosyltransferase
MPEVSVLIVTWNNENDIEACLKSVIANTENVDTEIICIDNDSRDSTYDKLKAVKYGNLQVYRSETNAGFTKGVNLAIKFARGKNMFLLNPDAILRNNCIEKLKNFLDDNENYAACCPKLLNEDNSIQCSIRNFPDYLSMFYEFSLLSYIFPRSCFFGKWRMKYFDHDTDSDVNQPMAAALMVRKSVLEKIDYMDERFEMFFNDVDLCKKIIHEGYKIRYISEAEAIHKKGTSIYQNREKMIKVWNKDCVKYFKKYHNNAFLILWLKFNLKISEIIRILYYKMKRQI